jgi:hypothetical protein
MPTILSRLRGLVAPSTPDQPLRLADGGGGGGTRGSLWYEGSGAPGSITGVLANDLYLDTATGNVWQYTTSWANVGNIHGANGTNGTDGTDGPPGTSLELTDGTTDLTTVSKITVTGATVGGTPAAATLTITGGGGGGVAVPGTIPDLVAWWESDDILVSSGNSVAALRERTPWITGILGLAAPSATIDATLLNGLRLLQWGASPSPYTLSLSRATPTGFTAFVVCRATSSGQRALFGGATNSLALYLDPPSTSKQLTLFNSGVAAIGAASTAWTSGVAFQANVTYNPTSGAYTFRQARAANGSGTGATGIGNGTLEWIGADFSSSTSNLENCSLGAIIIYNRVLTSTEITANETYINGKWGV